MESLVLVHVTINFLTKEGAYKSTEETKKVMGETCTYLEQALSLEKISYKIETSDPKSYLKIRIKMEIVGLIVLFMVIVVVLLWIWAYTGWK